MLGLGNSILKYTKVGVGGGSLSPLLDLYPNAFAGWSMRLINSDYEGACIQVMRGNDNAVLDIGFVKGLIDVDSMLAFVGANDGFVYIWYDQSGNGKDLQQDTLTKMMQIVDAGSLITSWSGLPAIRTNIASNSGGFNAMPKADWKWMHTDKATVFIVSETLNNGSYIFVDSDSGVVTTRVGVCMTGDIFVGNANGVAITDNPIAHMTADAEYGALRGADGIFLWDYDVNEASVLGRSSSLVNEVLSCPNSGVGAPSSADSYADFFVFGRRGGDTPRWSFYQEIVFWNERLDSDRQGIFGNGNQYYDIYGTERTTFELTVGEESTKHGFEIGQFGDFQRPTYYNESILVFDFRSGDLVRLSIGGAQFGSYSQVEVTVFGETFIATFDINSYLATVAGIYDLAVANLGNTVPVKIELV